MSSAQDGSRVLLSWRRRALPCLLVVMLCACCCGLDSHPPPSPPCTPPARFALTSQFITDRSAGRKRPAGFTSCRLLRQSARPALFSFCLGRWTLGLFTVVAPRRWLLIVINNNTFPRALDSHSRMVHKFVSWCTEPSQPRAWSVFMADSKHWFTTSFLQPVP